MAAVGAGLLAVNTGRAGGVAAPVETAVPVDDTAGWFTGDAPATTVEAAMETD